MYLQSNHTIDILSTTNHEPVKIVLFNCKAYTIFTNIDNNLVNRYLKSCYPRHSIPKYASGIVSSPSVLSNPKLFKLSFLYVSINSFV